MMRGRASAHQAITGIFGFFLLGVFALLSILMVLLGAHAYRDAVDRTDAHYTKRVASAYLRSMLRAADEEGVVRLEEYEGMPVITLENTYDEERYLTRIYVWQGALREWFMEAGEAFAPEDGEEVCAVQEMQAEQADALLTVRLRGDADWTETVLAMRAAQ